MMNPVFLGIDAGTTRIKAALVNHQGETIAMADCGAQVLRPHEGWSEMNMQALWEGLCNITQELKSSQPKAWEAVAGVGITAQGDGLWMMDQNGHPVGNALLWNDTRTRDLVLENRDEIDLFLSQHYSTPLFAGALPLLLCWVKKNEPERYQKVSTIFHCKDWLNYNLTGVVATDYTDAGCSGGVDIFSKAVLPQCFAMMGIPEAEQMHPALRASTDIIGGVTEAAAALTGIKAGTPVIAGSTDIIAVPLGAGVTQIGDKCTILGTTLCNEVLIGQDQVDHSDTHGSVQCGIQPDRYIRVMAAQSGMSTIDWAKALLAPDLTFNELEAELALRQPGADGILYHPYLHGERAPFKNSNACGGFYGLTARHTRFDLMRAVYEGLIYSLKDCYDHLPQGDGTLYVSGGGSKSDFLCQLTADMLNQPVARPAAKELGIYGIISALRVALGLTEDYNPVAPKGKSEFFPRVEVHHQLCRIYQSFLDLRRDMGDFWDARATWK